MNGDCDVVTECSSWVSFDDMDPELVTKVHGEKQCKYGYDSVKRCEAVCSLSRYSGVADNVKYECTCVTKQVAQAGLAAQSTTKSWIAGFMLLVGVICTVIACFCQLAAISMWCDSRTRKSEYMKLEEGSEAGSEAADAGEPGASQTDDDGAAGPEKSDGGEKPARGGAGVSNDQPNHNLKTAQATCCCFMAPGLLLIGLAWFLFSSGTPDLFIGCGKDAPQYYSTRD